MDDNSRGDMVPVICTGRFSSKEPNVMVVPRAKVADPGELTPGEAIGSILVDGPYPRTIEERVEVVKSAFHKWDLKHGETHELTFLPSEQEFVERSKHPGARVCLNKIANQISMWVELV